MPFDLDGRWLCPELFFGTMKATQRTFKKAVQAVIADGTWLSLNATNTCDIRDHPTAIVVKRAIRDYAPDSAVPLWRPYWVADFAELLAPASEPSVKVELDMLLDGMHSLWFTTGMLAYVCRSRHLKDFSEFLNRYIFWLPELDALSSRFRSERGLDGPMWWARPIMRCLSQLGYLGETQEEYTKAMSSLQSNGSLSNWLMQQNLIQQQGDRYSLLSRDS